MTVKRGLQMKQYFKRALLILILIMAITGLKAGPPYFTDDPDPVKFHHWDIICRPRIILMYEMVRLPDRYPRLKLITESCQMSSCTLLYLLTYQFSSTHDFEMGYTATEAGIKYRFVKEKKNIPEIGFFPLLKFLRLVIPALPTRRSRFFCRSGSRNPGRNSPLTEERGIGSTPVQGIKTGCSPDGRHNTIFQSF